MTITQSHMVRIPESKVLPCLHSLHQISASHHSRNPVSIHYYQPAYSVLGHQLQSVDSQGCWTHSDRSLVRHHCFANPLGLSLLARNRPNGRHRDNSEEFPV